MRNLPSWKVVSCLVSFTLRLRWLSELRKGRSYLVWRPMRSDHGNVPFVQVRLVDERNGAAVRRIGHEFRELLARKLAAVA